MQLGLLPQPTQEAKASKASSSRKGNVLNKLGLLPQQQRGQGGWGDGSYFSSEMFCSSPSGNFVAEDVLRTRQLPAVMCGTAQMPKSKSRSPSASGKMLSGSSQLQNLLLALVLAKAEEKSQREADQQVSQGDSVRKGRSETREGSKERTWSRTPSPENEPPSEPQFSNFFQVQLLAIYQGIQSARERSPAPRKSSDHENSERSERDFSNFFLSQLQAILSQAAADDKADGDDPGSPKSDTSEYSQPQFSDFFITQLQAIYPAVASAVMQQGP